MFKFEKVSRFAEVEIPAPIRKTHHSACYDLVAAEDVIIQPYTMLVNQIGEIVQNRKITPEVAELIDKTLKQYGQPRASELINTTLTLTLEEVGNITKEFGLKPTLIPTGYKVKLEEGYTLELYSRSSTPLKYWLMAPHSVGIIDADYYNNPDNEGEIFFQFINLLPIPVKIHKGEVIGQAKITKFEVTEDDDKQEKQIRTSGFGSTGKGEILSEEESC